MSWFHVNSELKSYRYPIIKILVCLLLIVLTVVGLNFLYTERVILNFVFSLVRAGAVLVFVFCISISFAEMVIIGDRSAETKIAQRKFADVYSIDQIRALAEKNDIVEIVILFHGKTVKLGSSAECKNGSATFFNKRFYVGDKEFAEIDSFVREVQNYAECGKYTVVSIDGAAPQFYKPPAL